MRFSAWGYHVQRKPIFPCWQVRWNMQWPIHQPQTCLYLTIQNGWECHRNMQRWGKLSAQGENCGLRSSSDRPDMFHASSMASREWISALICPIITDANTFVWMCTKVHIPTSLRSTTLILNRMAAHCSAVCWTIFLNSASTLMQYFLLPLNRSKYYPEYTFKAVCILMMLNPGTLYFIVCGPT